MGNIRLTPGAITESFIGTFADKMLEIHDVLESLVLLSPEGYTMTAAQDEVTFLQDISTGHIFYRAEAGIWSVLALTVDYTLDVTNTILTLVVPATALDEIMYLIPLFGTGGAYDFSGSTVTLPADTTIGGVTPTELSYLDATSSIQTQFNAKINTSLMGAVNGVATLGADGLIPSAQLPLNVMQYIGTWNASTNSPTLIDGTGTIGDTHKVSVGAAINLGSGSITYTANDYVILNSGLVWEKLDNTELTEVSNTAFSSGWDTVTDIAPSKNAVYDEVILKENIVKLVNALSSSAGVVTVSLTSTTEHYLLTLTEDITSWAFTNFPASGKFVDISIDVIQHASSAKAVLSPASAGRTAGSVWVVSSTVSSVETLALRVNSAQQVTLYTSGVMV